MAHQSNDSLRPMLVEITQVLLAEPEYAAAARQIEEIERRHLETVIPGEELDLRRSVARMAFIVATDKGASFEEISARFHRICDIGFSTATSEWATLIEFADACRLVGRREQGLQILDQACKRLPDWGFKREAEASAMIELCRQRLESGDIQD